ncbi:MAG: sorbosone dehydrogenase family protein [Acidobacteria bacterium]|nr:sorbosone dehydrogenase family protein [Acidobacteriota bacterium]
MRLQSRCLRRLLLGFGSIFVAFGCGRALPLAGPADLDLIELPPGFQIAVFAENLPGARLMAFSPSGLLLVSLTREGSVMALGEADRAGRATRPYAFLQGLNRPHGLAFEGGDLYVAETGRVLRFPGADGALRAGRSMQPSQAAVVVPDLPAGGMHFTRTIVFGPQKELFISVGSDCNVCEERDQRRAAVLRLPKGGDKAEVYASGLRNAVGLRINPEDGKLWTTDNGRDMLGDDLPPEEINIITGPGHYGWPYCYGNNVPNPEYDDPARCRDKIPPALGLPAHNAPMGLDFYQEDKFPEEYRGDLFVGLHGSWNRSTPDGYKVVRVRVENGKPVRWENFATGWLQGGRAWGRPVDVLSGPDGALYVSDDRAGVVYRITHGE